MCMIYNDSCGYYGVIVVVIVIIQVIGIVISNDLDFFNDSRIIICTSVSWFST